MRNFTGFKNSFSGNMWLISLMNKVRNMTQDPLVKAYQILPIKGKEELYTVIVVIFSFLAIKILFIYI